eukprot:1852497-Pyramimonas_sp.AAC.1
MIDAGSCTQARSAWAGSARSRHPWSRRGRPGRPRARPLGFYSPGTLGAWRSARTPTWPLEVDEPLECLPESVAPHGIGVAD